MHFPIVLQKNYFVFSKYQRLDVVSQYSPIVYKPKMNFNQRQIIYFLKITISHAMTQNNLYRTNRSLIFHSTEETIHKASWKSCLVNLLPLSRWPLLQPNPIPKSNSSEQMLLIFSAQAKCLTKEVKNRL